MEDKSKDASSSTTTTTTTSTPASFPLSRIKTIMKSAPDSLNISQESVFVVEKASELLVSYLITEAHKHSSGKKLVTYKDLATVVNSEENLEFLRDIIPQKIKLGDYLDILAKVEKEEKEQADL